MITVYHKKGIDWYACENRMRKSPSIFIFKWFCPICNRYILPDGKKHFWTADTWEENIKGIKNKKKGKTK